jgi:hypothetical protein
MFIFLIIVITVFVLIAVASAKAAKAHQKFVEEYNEFLANNEGLEVFCYTNRLKFCDVIEAQLVPTLDKHIHVIKLIGKVPQTQLNERFISHALCKLKEVGFPNVMRVVDGRFVDLSLHKPVYDAINNKNNALLPSLVHEKLKKLRGLV